MTGNLVFAFGGLLTLSLSRLLSAIRLKCLQRLQIHLARQVRDVLMFVDLLATRFGARPLCCGRTYLAAGQTGKARGEVARTIETLLPYVQSGARIVGLEPSCILTFRDEFFSLANRQKVQQLALSAFLIEGLLANELAAGMISLDAADQGGRVAHVHGHCHQKSFGVMGSVERLLRAMPGLDVRVIESSCCGMAGAFGYAAETVDVSFKMGELSLFPALRSAGPDDLIVADGTSCRHQIRDGVDRQAIHVVRVLEEVLRSGA